MSIWRLVFSQRYHEVLMQSVHHYTCPDDDDPVIPQALCQEFQVQWQNAYEALQNVDVTSENIYVRHVSEPSQWATLNVSGSGDVGNTSSGLNPAWALSFTGNVVGSEIRHSYKRLSGIDKVMVTDGELTASYSAATDVFCAKMVAVLNRDGFSFTPVAARYSEPPNSVLINTGTITSAVYRKMSTQRSRLT